ncbi:hypothetical protein [Motilimonas eburnea]|uniref:hypothetical protein n=1 Tax=Motilimonas eburnea TaxID=1737488 RepID=UPI001E2A8181|nr:hypothetical protein [Motilimonas eburnea]MCE2572802.1 hypothetical protein [Motilimonas eburnea]
MNNRKKILAIASTGGHYVQLGNIIKQTGYQPEDVCLIRTKISKNDTPAKVNELLVSDISRDTLWRLPIITFQLAYYLLKFKPRWVITTGAMPGLIAIFLARIFFIKTVWVDSIANTKKLSASGRIAQRFAHKVLTQWPELTDSKIEYHGKVI